MKTPDRNRIFDVLAQHDIAKVVMEFSGGHDEGDVENWEFHNTDPTKEVEFVPPAPALAVYKKLQEDMEEVMLAHFGYFNGRPSAWGAVVWDVSNRKVFLHGEQEVIATEKIDEEL